MSENNKRCTEEYVGRDVIENQLLTTLRDDKSKVAILATRDDLQVLIRALRWGHTNQGFAKDLEQLRDAAFGKE